MARLLLLYSLIILVSRVFKGFRESRRTAPQRREPVPVPPAKVGVDTYQPKEKRAPTDVPFFPAVPRVRPRKDLVPPREAKDVEVHGRGPQKGEELAGKGRKRRAVRGLFSGPEAYAQGIIMSEVLQPPRSKRPWRPLSF